MWRETRPKCTNDAWIAIRALHVLLVSFVVLVGALGRDPPRSTLHADSFDATGLQVTVAATSERPEAAQAPPLSGALLVQVTLENHSGDDLTGLSLRSPVPPLTVVTDSWLGQPGQNLGFVQDSHLTWTGLAIANGAQLGPFAYRLTPQEKADGAMVFLTASIQPEVSWTAPIPDSAAVPVLPLNGLWGEENLRRTVLPTGLTIFTQERPDTPTVALRLAARAGSRDEDDTTCGGSHWLEHAHFLGTTTRPDNQAVARPIEAIGGEFDAATGWEETSFWDLVPANKFDVAIDVLADQMTNSTFPPDAFEREKQVIIQEIKERADAPSTHAFDQFMSLVFQVSPLGRSPAATVCLLTLPISTILGYRAQHYTTYNIVIAASGNLLHDDTVAKLAQAFAGLPVGPRIARSRIPEPIEAEPRMVETGIGSGPVEIRIGWPVIGEQDHDWPEMIILSNILGSVGERLQQTAHDNHLAATGVDAAYLDFSDAGALMLRAAVPQEQVQSVIDSFLQEVQRLRDGNVSDADVQESIRAIAGERAVADELNLDQTDRATAAAADILQSYDEALARLETVHGDDIQRVADEYLDPVNFSLVILHQ